MDNPEGKHLEIVHNFYEFENGKNNEPLSVKLDYIVDDWHRFDRYLLKICSDSSFGA
ncbi:MAG: hypothetical protein JKY70_02550 [Mucilaginibacter sp.]|nr:hypothetical protein [Mucilaginibacter sp.]